MLIPPLRIPVYVDISEILSIWLDAVRQGFLSSNDNGSESELNNGSEKDPPDFSTGECQGDLKLLNRLRREIGDTLTVRQQQQQRSENGLNNDKPKELISLLQDYHACLIEFENRGFPSVFGFTTPLEWISAFSNDYSEVSVIKFGHKGLFWERASILWNLASLEAFIATRQENSPKGWKVANKGFQSAYSYMHHLNKLMDSNSNHISPNNDGDFQMVKFWEDALKAQAQMAGFESPASGKRQQHALLSKLAVAAAPLWDEAKDSILQHQQQNVGSQSWPHQRHLIGKLALYAEALSLFMKSKAEYHESEAVAKKGNKEEQFAERFARLEISLHYGNTCYDNFRSYESGKPEELEFLDDLQAYLGNIRQCYEEMLSSGAGSGNRPEIRDIRGQLLVKGPIDLSKTMLEWNLPEKEDERMPLFANLMGPEGRAAVSKFHKDMEQFVSQISMMIDEKTEEARRELASVNLPHSLTEYKQEQSGGGIPSDLWQRVEKIQRTNRISTLKRELWNLRDIADQAQHTFKKIQKDLQDDVEMDDLFRQQNPDFRGTDVQQIQKSFKQSLSNYQKLLVKSQDGDSILLRRLERLDQDSKFKLLQFRKEQLDLMLPGNDNVANDPRRATFDTAPLSRILVDLSTLFNNRDMTLDELKQMIRDYDIQPVISEVDPSSPTAAQDYKVAVEKAQSKAFSGLAHEIQHNLAKQDALLDQIMVLNRKFENARRMEQQNYSGNSGSSDSCIAMIEDAIDEIDTLSKHLSEGKDFYNVVIPKLTQLQNQVSDASARLTADRCEYEDSYNVNRRRQEEEDARMAASLMQNSQSQPPQPPPPPQPQNDNSGDNNTHIAITEQQHQHQPERPNMVNQPDNPTQGQQFPRQRRNSNRSYSDNQHSHPGVVNVSHDEPQVRVDDEKVASLVAMDFDPDKVVNALRKYDNNVEQALNELLSG